MTHLPHVEQLKVVVPSRELLHSSRRDRYRLVDMVTKYHPPAYCQRLPRLTVESLGSERVFVGVKDEHSQLQYGPVLSDI
jgi:hypothetical protein